MKLGTLRSGDSRDGVLVVVSRDLSVARPVPEIAPTLQAALDRFREVRPLLAQVASALEEGDRAATLPLTTDMLRAPLPRAYQWVDGSAYVNHVELVRLSRGVAMPESFWTDPLMYQGASDDMLGATESIVLPTEDDGIDFEAEVAVIVDDVPMGIAPSEAAEHICLIVLVNDVSLRTLAQEELKKGFGFVQCKPATGFSPVAVTPDELGPSWDGKRVSLPLTSRRNGEHFGSPNAGVDMVFDFPTLIAHAARTRRLCAGTIVGSGTVSNRDRSVGSSCIVERRAIETLDTGAPKTPYLRFGEEVTIEMICPERGSIFGAIQQRIAPLESARQRDRSHT